MLPETTAANAFLTAERIRCRLTENGFSGVGDEKRIDLSSSAGIAAFPDHDQGLDGVIRKADAALYYSKKLGKNRVSVYSEESFSLSSGSCPSVAGMTSR